MDKPPGPEDRSEEETEDLADDGVIGEIEAEEPAEEAPVAEPRRTRRRRSRLIGCLLALLGAVAGGALALWISSDAVTNQQDAEVVAPANEVEGPAAELPTNRVVFSPTSERPEQTPEIISAETDSIYVFYDLGRLPADAPLSAAWSHEGENLGEIPLSDHVPDPEADHARGRFILHPPAANTAEDAPEAAAAGFPPGIYEVSITSAEYPEVTATGSFVALPRAAQVLEGGGEPEGPPVIRSLQTAADVTEDGEPVGQASAFSADAERITAVFSYEGLSPGSVLTVRWHAGDTELTQARADIPVTSPSGRAEAWLGVDDGDSLPPEEYRVTVHLGDDDQPLASTGFVVAASGPPEVR